MLLFLQFFRIGCFTFGGGWSIIAQLQKDYVENKQVLKSEELLDITSVGRSLPGTMIGNVAFLFGYRVCGIPGAIACVLGIVLPPLLILIEICFFYELIKDNIFVAKAMIGVRSAVAPIIIGAVYKLLKGAFPYPACYAVLLAGFGLYLFLDISCIYIVILAALSGLAISKLFMKEGNN
jgi:chromate transporter